MKTYSRIVLLLAVVVMAMGVGCGGGDSPEDDKKAAFEPDVERLVVDTSDYQQFLPVDRTKLDAATYRKLWLTIGGLGGFLFAEDPALVEKTLQIFKPPVKKPLKHVSETITLTNSIMLFMGQFLTGPIVIKFDDVNSEMTVNDYLVEESRHQANIYNQEFLSAVQDRQSLMISTLEGRPESYERLKECLRKYEQVNERLIHLKPYSDQKWLAAAKTYSNEAFPNDSGYQLHWSSPNREQVRLEDGRIESGPVMHATVKTTTGEFACFLHFRATMNREVEKKMTPASADYLRKRKQDTYEGLKFTIKHDLDNGTNGRQFYFDHLFMTSTKVWQAKKTVEYILADSRLSTSESFAQIWTVLREVYQQSQGPIVYSTALFVRTRGRR